MKSRPVLSGGKKIQLMYFPEHCYLGVQWFNVFYCVKYNVDRMLVNILLTLSSRLTPVCSVYSVLHF